MQGAGVEREIIAKIPLMRRQLVRWSFCLTVAMLGSAPRLGLSQPVDTSRPNESPAAREPTTALAAPNSANIETERARVLRALADLQAWAEKRGAKLSALVVDLSEQRSIASAEPQLPLNPASNQKIILVAGAFALLGPSYRFETGVYGSVEEGVADSLVVRGNGDPAFSAQDLWGLAENLLARGLTRVKGPVLVDQSAFDDRFTPPGFEQQPDEWAAFRAPVSAVALNQNTVTLFMLPGKAGERARIWSSPPGVLTSQGSVLTRPKGSANTVSLQLSLNGSQLSAKISGAIAQGQPLQRFTRRVADPRLVPGMVLKQLLKERGVQLADGVELGGASETRLLASVKSEPLARLAFELGKESDNFYAEMLLKAIAKHEAPGAGTSEGGAAALAAWLKRRNLWVAGTVLRNGSGLFDANRVSAQQIINVLADAQQNSRLAAEFLSQLSVAGRDGTLRARFPKERSSGVIRAKTGSLSRADALSGYVLVAGRPRFAFSILLNGVAEHAESRKRIDSVVQIVADLARVSSPEQVDAPSRQ